MEFEFLEFGTLLDDKLLEMTLFLLMVKTAGGATYYIETLVIGIDLF